MTFRDGWKRLLRVGVPSIARDVDSEISFHFEQKIQDFIAQGMSPGDARARATEEFGDVDTVRDQLQTIDKRVAQKRKRADWWEAGAQDLRYVVRTLRRSPGFTAGVVITLALGLGANAALFSLLDQLYLRAPQGVAQPENLRRVYWQTHNRQNYVRRGYSVPDIRDIGAALGDGARIAGVRFEKVRIGREMDSPLRNVAYVLDDYLGVLGAKPALGRFFAADEYRPEGLVPVAVLSHTLWQNEFSGDSSIIGRSIDLGSKRFTVIGIAAEGFRGLDLNASDLWLPINASGVWKDRDPNWFNNRNANGISAVVRIPDHANVDPLNTRMTIRMRDSSVSPYPKSEMYLGSIHEARIGELNNKESAISLRMGGVALVILAIACANVINLLLARAMRRRREIALRLALGVSRRRLMMQLITESGVLALVSGMVSLTVAFVGATVLRKFLLPDIQWAESAITQRVILFTIGMSILVGLVAGLLPAIQSSHPNLARSLRGGTREGTHHKSRVRSGLLVMQAALSVVLLAGAGLFVRSLRNVENVDIGYATERLMFASVSFDAEASTRPTNVADRIPQVVERIRKLPGVESVGLSGLPPFYGFSFGTVKLPGRDSLPPSNGIARIMSSVSPEYFATVGIRVLRGRAFVDSDREGAPKVMAMNELMAKNLWPGEDPLTKCVIVGDDDPTCRAVVAIVSHANFSSILEGPSMQYYLPLAQADGKRTPSIAVRTSAGRTGELSAQVRRMLLDEYGVSARPRMLIMRDMLAPELRPWRVGAALFSAAGFLALIVAAVGVHSSLSYTISQRTHELGVRVALGARRTDIVRLVLGEGLRTVVVGIAVGLMAALAMGKLVQSLLYNTSPRDPLVLSLVAAGLIAVAVVACLMPAWRAARTDPMDALRAE